MMNKERHYSEVKTVEQTGILFDDGSQILFQDCARMYDSDTCVAVRDVTAAPPYFEFRTPEQPIRIIFDRSGVFAADKNRKDFHSLQFAILKAGFKTFDLS